MQTAFYELDNLLVLLYFSHFLQEDIFGIFVFFFKDCLYIRGFLTGFIMVSFAVNFIYVLRLKLGCGPK